MGQGCIWEERGVMGHIEFNKIVMFMKRNSSSPNTHWGFPASVRVLVFGCCLSAASHPLPSVLWGRTGTKEGNCCVCCSWGGYTAFQVMLFSPSADGIAESFQQTEQFGCYRLPAPELVLAMWHLQRLQTALPSQGRHWQVRVPASTRPSLSWQGLAAEL